MAKQSRNSKKTRRQLDKLFHEVARDEFFIETLETRNMDSLDFHEVSVIGVRNAFQRIFEAGLKVGIEVGMNSNK